MSDSSPSRRRISSGTPWESEVAYCRAVQAGNLVFVSGTTASDTEGKVLGIGDPYRQTQVILEKIESALKELGGGLESVVRTRMFVTDIECWQDIGRAHAEAFGSHPPAATMVEVQRLVNVNHLVEIEVDAVLDSNGPSRGE